MYRRRKPVSTAVSHSYEGFSAGRGMLSEEGLTTPVAGGIVPRKQKPQSSIGHMENTASTSF